MGKKRIVVWMRRSLRVQDHTPLWNAVQDAEEVIPVVCLKEQYPGSSLRGEFLKSVIRDCDDRLHRLGSRLFVRTGDPAKEIPSVAAAHGAEAVYAVRVYDPASLRRDRDLARELRKMGTELVTWKDSVLVEGGEVVSSSGAPYRLFSPYRRAWLERSPDLLPVLPDLRKISSPEPREGDLSLDRLPGFRAVGPGRGESAASQRLDAFVRNGLRLYKRRRDLPGLDGTSRLSPYLASGAISIRRVFHQARGTRAVASEGSALFQSELIWREFYYQILHHFPSVLTSPFRREMQRISWRVDRRLFAKWCRGETGFPIVDAGMRQLLIEGWMHNRVRMIVASFLTKDLHLDWRWGERYFMTRLIDADLASNNGGWQWSAGTGTDASPWFRIFNPSVQGERFDPDGTYVRKFIPELSAVPKRAVHRPWILTALEQKESGCILGRHYPRPILDHAEERAVTLSLYSGRR
jgi:deoxyribodipyrimidine photo-lyase